MMDLTNLDSALTSATSFLKFTTSNHVSGIKMKATKTGIRVEINKTIWEKSNDREKQGILRKTLLHLYYNHLSKSKDKNPLLWQLTSDSYVNTSVPELKLLYTQYKKMYPTPEQFGFPEFISDDILYYMLENHMEEVQVSASPSDMMMEYEDESEGKANIFENMAVGEYEKEGGQLLKDKPPGHRSHDLNIDFTFTKHEEWVRNVIAWLTRNFKYTRKRSYRRENRQNLKLTPGRASTLKPDYKVALVLDVSGSMENDLNNLISSLKGLIETYHIEGWFLTTDTEVKMKEKINPSFKLPTRFEGLGGTDFENVMEELKSLEIKQVVFITDGQTANWGKQPCSTLWCMTMEGEKPPYGDVLYINE